MEPIFDLFSFSSTWNGHNNSSGAVLMEEIRALGFKKVELNYKISEEKLATILPMLENDVIEVTSVHNVFPRVDDPAYDTDSLLLGYPDSEKRKKSISLTKRSVDYAAMLGAKAVVIHPGEVPINEKGCYDVLLKELYRLGKKDTEQYKRLFNEMMHYREKNSMKYVELIRQSLEEISEYIIKKNYKVVLGIENRAMCHQIPDFKEAHYLLNQLEGCPVYFWYDIGHGMVLDNIGMFNNLKEVYQIKDRIIGLHIHDAVGVSDHWTPYIHSNNMDRFVDLIKDIPVKVLELGGKNKPEEIKKGVAMLYEKLRKT